MFQRLYPTESMSEDEFVEYSCFERDGVPKKEAYDIFSKPFMKKDFVNATQLMVKSQ